MFTNILARLPNTNRKDYKNILECYDLSITSDEFEILKKTRGRLLTDTFEFVQVFNKSDIEFDIAGTRYIDEVKECCESLKKGDNVFLEEEKENNYDSNAVIVLKDRNNKDCKLGYVPNYYSKQISKIIQDKCKYTATILKIRKETLLNDEMITIKISFE